MSKPSLYLPPSGAGTWTSCTIQPVFLRDNRDILPDKEDSDASLEGVLAHALAATKLLDTPEPTGPIPGRVRDNVDRYIQFLQTLSVNEIVRGIELKVPPFYAPKRNAYIDFVNVTVHPTIQNTLTVSVADYKNGRYPVHAEENKQCAIYARSVLPWVKSHLPKHLKKALIVVQIYIYQPNVDDEEDPVRGPWIMTETELVEWTDREIGSIAEQIYAERDLKFESNDKNCHFCQASEAGICPARTAALFGSSEYPEDILPVSTPALDPSMPPKEKVLAMLPHVDNLIKFCGGVKEYARQLAERGIIGEADGYKRVKGKGSRDWKHEDFAASVLSIALDEGDIRPRTFISPARAEELLQSQKIPGYKKIINTLVDRTPGRPLLVPVSDPREALTDGPSDNFDVSLDDEDRLALSDS